MDVKSQTTIVIFGASGDLTQRKLIPALFQLSEENLLPSKVRIVGFARREKSHEEFRDEMQDALQKYGRSKNAKDAAKRKEFASQLHYYSGSYDDKESFLGLKELLHRLDKELGVKEGETNRLFYLSVPPNVFAKVVTQLGEAGLISDPFDKTRWTRVIVEKPFGHDLQSAHSLNRQLLSILDESQVYRIDHYLGKETVQNIMAFRFGNSIYEPLWNRRYVDHVQITVAEAVSVGGRGGYYDHSGALRDMVQNHMLQLLALVAMEPPASFAPNAVRDEKVKVLSALRPIGNDDIKTKTVRGQYVSGSIDGKSIQDYINEPGVDPNSRTETYVALKAHVDNWRWAGVPFYLRTGKALPQRMTEITIEFRQPPLALFSHAQHEGHVEGDRMQPNRLCLRVQPNEGIRLSFGLKIPGPRMNLQPTDMEFDYADVFDAEPPEAYERLIPDAMLGDSTLFIRHDEVEAAWTFVDGILAKWAADHSLHIHPYRAGTWGPIAASDFMAQDDRKWAQR